MGHWLVVWVGLFLYRIRFSSLFEMYLYDYYYFFIYFLLVLETLESWLLFLRYVIIYTITLILLRMRPEYRIHPQNP